MTARERRQILVGCHEIGVNSGTIVPKTATSHAYFGKNFPKSKSNVVIVIKNLVTATTGDATGGKIFPNFGTSSSRVRSAGARRLRAT